MNLPTAAPAGRRRSYPTHRSLTIRLKNMKSTQRFTSATILVALSVCIIGCGSTSESIPTVDENFAAEQEIQMEEIAKEQEEQMRREQEMMR